MKKTKMIKKNYEFKNVLTKEGFTFMFTSIVDNFQNFRPLILLVISLIAISIGEASGLFKAVFRKSLIIKKDIDMRMS